MSNYRVIKSDKTKGEEGNYQLQEKCDNFSSGYRTCGVYLLKKEAIEAMEKMIANDN